MLGQDIVITPIELLALKKLALICDALGKSLSDRSVAAEQQALTKVLVAVIARADLANNLAKAIAGKASE